MAEYPPEHALHQNTGKNHGNEQILQTGRVPYVLYYESGKTQPAINDNRNH